MPARQIQVSEWELFQILESVEDAIVELESSEDASQPVIDRLAETQGILSNYLGLFEESGE